jgi:cytochrome c-type biogenesis protein CcmH
MNRLAQTLILTLLLCGVTHAAIDTYEFSSDAERARFRLLTEQLRCPKCQNQNIADSNAPIAKDLRAQIFRMFEAGNSDEQIMGHLVSRYGDFVLYKPPVTSRTLMLWYAPAILLAGGLALVGVIVIRRRRGHTALAPGLSPEEQKRLARLLEQASDKSGT